MKKWIAASAALTAGAVVVARASTRRDAALEEVFSDNDFQITGVTVSPDGRIFVNYPRWSDLYLNAVVEVLPGGIAQPYPDSEWNGWDRKPHTAADHFVCVQSVVADDEGSLWVLDPAAPMLTSPVPHGPKLVQIDLASNQVSQVIRFGPDVIRDDSYLNDVRIDRRTGTGYITDSGAGGIVVVDLATGRARRTLDGHPSVMAQDGVQVVIEGKPVLDAQGQPPKFNSDGIALSTDGAWLYYQPITATSLFRIRTEVLRDTTRVTRGDRSRGRTLCLDLPGRWTVDRREGSHLLERHHPHGGVTAPAGSHDRAAGR